MQARAGWKREQQMLLNELRTHERLARQNKRLPQGAAANGGGRLRPASTEGQVLPQGSAGGRCFP